jgi:hypothetical protein
LVLQHYPSALYFRFAPCVVFVFHLVSYLFLLRLGPQPLEQRWIFSGTEEQRRLSLHLSCLAAHIFWFAHLGGELLARQFRDGFGLTGKVLAHAVQDVTVNRLNLVSHLITLRNYFPTVLRRRLAPDQQPHNSARQPPNHGQRQTKDASRSYYQQEAHHHRTHLAINRKIATQIGSDKTIAMPSPTNAFPSCSS